MQRVHALELSHFRRYEYRHFTFEETGQAFVGPNAAGKTTLLEALHKVALLRGFGKENELVQWGQDGYRLRARLSSGLVEVAYQKAQGTRVVWQGEEVRPLAEWIGRLPVVVLRASDTEWIEGPAALRRRWADRLLSQLSPAYLAALSRYQQALAARSALLAQSASLEELQAWERLLIQEGLVLQRHRLDLAEALQASLERFYSELGPEKPHLTYRLAVEPAEEAWRRAWERWRPLEQRRGYTLLGPHAEDFVLSLDDKPARGYTSEGQKKSLLIALKWAETIHLSQRHRPPLLLLDDIGEKLDSQRLKAVGRLARLASQTFLTDTDPQRVQRAFPELPLCQIK